jgi:hypothetical protein
MQFMVHLDSPQLSPSPDEPILHSGLSRFVKLALKLLCSDRLLTGFGERGLQGSMIGLAKDNSKRSTAAIFNYVWRVRNS